MGEKILNAQNAGLAKIVAIYGSQKQGKLKKGRVEWLYTLIKALK